MLGRPTWGLKCRNHPDLPARARGLCTNCYAVWRRSPEFTRLPPKTIGCEECASAPKIRGLCGRCYQAYRKRPDFKPAERPEYAPRGSNKTKACSTCGDTPVSAKGLCRRCYLKADRIARKEERDADPVERSLFLQQAKEYKLRHRLKDPFYKPRAERAPHGHAPSLDSRIFQSGRNGRTRLAKRLGLIEAQGNVCPICKRPFTEDLAPQVDHDHSLEVRHVRGLPCGPCNRGLGMFADDIERLLGAVVYLREWEPRRAALVAEHGRQIDKRPGARPTEADTSDGPSREGSDLETRADGTAETGGNHVE